MHGAMATIVRTLAKGESVDLPHITRETLKRWEKIVDQSFSLPPGVFSGDVQLAEAFNGSHHDECREQTAYWKEVLPMMLENGFRASATIGIRRESDDFRIQAEQQRFWKRGNRTTHMVFDVLITSPYRTVVVDFKAHGITTRDHEQLCLYLSYWHSQGIPVSKLSAFAVDLLREEIVPVSFNPYRVSSSLQREAVKPVAAAPGEGGIDPYPARPDPEICRACSFRNLCDSAA